MQHYSDLQDVKLQAHVILNYFKIYIHVLPDTDNYKHSFVMITCNDNLVDSAIEEIREIPNVVAVNRLQGMYDIMVQLKASNEAMKETIRTKIRYVEGVRSVLTLFVYNSSFS